MCGRCVIGTLHTQTYKVNVTPFKTLQEQFDAAPNKWAVLPQFFGLIQDKGACEPIFARNVLTLASPGNSGQCALDDKNSFNKKFFPHVKTASARDVLHHQVRTHK